MDVAVNSMTRLMYSVKGRRNKETITQCRNEEYIESVCKCVETVVEYMKEINEGKQCTFKELSFSWR